MCFYLCLTMFKLFMLVYPYLFLFILGLYLFIDPDPSLRLFMLVYACLCLFILVYPCLSICILVHPCSSLLGCFTPPEDPILGNSKQLRSGEGPTHTRHQFSQPPKRGLQINPDSTTLRKHEPGHLFRNLTS